MISTLAVVVLMIKLNRGQLTHLSHECIDRTKVTMMIVLKVLFFTIWLF